MVSRFSLKSYQSRIYKPEAMEAVLWLVNRVYFFYSPDIEFCSTLPVKFTSQLDMTSDLYWSLIGTNQYKS